MTRITKTNDAAAAAVASDNAANSPQNAVDRGTGWSMFLALLLGVILVPLSFAARLDTQAVLSPEFGPEATNYITALSFTAGFHLLLAVLIVGAILRRFRHTVLNIVVLEMLLGYGAASLMLAAVVA